MRARLLILVVLAMAMPVLASTAQPQGAGTPNAPAPPGWADTRSKIMTLGFDGKYQEIAAIAEPLVAKYPRFADAHFWLGSAHENMARGLARTDRAAALTHFETTETHYRQAFDLGCGENPDACIRGLIDLYEYALPRPDRWKATILDATTRYAKEPAAHWYAVQLLLRDGRLADLDGTFRTARTALPPSPKTRLEYASLLAGLAQKSAPGPARIALANEALALSNDITKAHPADRFGQDAQSIRDDALKALGKKP